MGGERRAYRVCLGVGRVLWRDEENWRFGLYAGSGLDKKRCTWTVSLRSRVYETMKQKSHELGGVMSVDFHSLGVDRRSHEGK